MKDPQVKRQGAVRLVQCPVGDPVLSAHDLIVTVRQLDSSGNSWRP